VAIARRSGEEIAAIREAGRIVADALELARGMLRAGVTTGEIDRAVEELVAGKGGSLLFKGYRGFPASTCISVNEEVVHGIPGERVLAEGDLVSIDIGVGLDGWCADAARTFSVGAAAPRKKTLAETARGALAAAVAVLRPGMRLVEVSRAIQDYVESRGFSVVRQYVGHGIGREMHEEPQVPNFVDGSVKQATMVLPEGCVLAIEPMVNAGNYEVEILPNGWTVVTKDRRPSAHWEDTVAITRDGPVTVTV
jgi:methionyl aminopeptidase